MNQNPLPCVFIADDDEDDCYVLAKAFATYSPQCRLVFADDGSTLLEALSQSAAAPNLILLDLNMPRLDGFETLKVLRQHPTYQHTPVVILTTSEAHQDRQRASELGANNFITKPINGAQLGQAVLQLQEEWLAGKCC